MPEEDITEASNLDTQHPTLQSRANVEPVATGSQSSRSSFLSVPECSVSNISDEDLDCECAFKKKSIFLQLNVTSLSTPIINWLIEVSNTHVHGFLLQETKLRGQKYRDAKAKLKNHFHVVATQASIKDVGPSGGVMVLVNKNITVLPKGV